MFAGVAVADLVNPKHNHGQKIKLNDISPRFVGKIVELQGVASDFGPVGDRDSS